MLELQGVHTYRGAAHVLQGVSLRVGAGEAVCLVGRNGAGKTTTIESTMGLLPIRGGRILPGARHHATPDPRARPPRHRLRPGGRRIFPDLTVAENFEISRSLVPAERKGASRGHRRRRARVRPLPRSAAVPQAPGAQPLRRPEEDGGHRASADPVAVDPPAGRALRGPRAGRGEPVHRRGPADQGDGSLAPDRRVESRDGEPDRRPALRHRPRRDHLQGAPARRWQRGDHAHPPRVRPDEVVGPCDGGPSLPRGSSPPGSPHASHRHRPRYGSARVEEETSLQEIRDFVGATAQRYRMVAPLQVSVAWWVGNPSLSQYAWSPAVYARARRLLLNRRLLRASNRDLVIARHSPTMLAGQERPRSRTESASSPR